MSSRRSWVLCVFVAIGFGPAAFAQSPVGTASETPVVPLAAVPEAAPFTAPVTPAAAPAQFLNRLVNSHERLKWLLVENLGSGALLDDVAVGAVDTLFNSPKEYKTHWLGFAERTGMVTANYGVKSTMEAGFGSIWGEDPRYDQTEGQSFGHRLGHVIKMTFLARDRNGKTMPAYSRYIAIPGSSFLANQWLPDSQATNSDAAVRAGLGFLSRMAENAYKEFIARRH